MTGKPTTARLMHYSAFILSVRTENPFSDDILKSILALKGVPEEGIDIRKASDVLKAVTVMKYQIEVLLDAFETDEHPLWERVQDPLFLGIAPKQRVHDVSKQYAIDRYNQENQ